MAASRLLCLILALCCGSAQARALQGLVQTTQLAGFAHHAGPAVWAELREGDTLSLVLERDNPFDPQAVRVDWHGRPLGYLPASLNGAIARELVRGTPLTARIATLRAHPDPRQRVRIDILMPL